MLTNATVVYYNSCMKQDTYKQETLEVFRKSLRSLEREIAINLEHETTCCGVSLAQCHVILEIQIQEGITIGELSDILALDKSTISRTVFSLEQKSLINKTEDTENRRRTLLKLSKEGEAVAKKINQSCNESYARLISEMDVNDARKMIEGTELLSKALKKLRGLNNSCCATKGE